MHAWIADKIRIMRLGMLSLTKALLTRCAFSVAVRIMISVRENGEMFAPAVMKPTVRCVCQCEECDGTIEYSPKYDMIGKGPWPCFCNSCDTDYLWLSNKEW